MSAEACPSADEVVRKAAARAQQAAATADEAGYSYTKVTVTEELDAAGNVKERKEKHYQVWFQNGSTCAKLLEVNGHPSGAADAKLQAQNELNARQWLGQPKSSKTGHRENLLTPELAARFDFTLLGQAPVHGRPAYQVAFQPKSPAPPVHHVVDRLLNRISGVLWIDAQEFEIARAELHLRSEVELLGGVIGSLKKLAFTLTRTRVAEGIWLNSSSSGDFEGRKLLDPMRIKTKSQSTNFRLVRLPS